MADPELLLFPTVDELCAAAATRAADLVVAAVAQRGACLIALSGGSLPPRINHLLASPPLHARIPWQALRIIWADERYVPWDAPESNYWQARQTLLDHTPIPADQVYPVPTYLGPDQAADLYDQQLRALLAAHGGRIDIALLGMGPDGHTASLFPQHPALAAPADRYAVVVRDAPKPPPTRISLTAAALNCMAHAIFLVAGADKAIKVRAALRGPYDPQSTPAQLVRPAHGEVVWMLDAAAAGEL